MPVATMPTTKKVTKKEDYLRTVLSGKSQTYAERRESYTSYDRVNDLRVHASAMSALDVASGLYNRLMFLAEFSPIMLSHKLSLS